MKARWSTFIILAIVLAALTVYVLYGFVMEMRFGGPGGAP